MTDEQAFAWLRSLVGPNVTTIEVWDDPVTQRRVLRLKGATPEQVERVRSRVGLRFPFIPWQVRP